MGMSCGKTRMQPVSALRFRSVNRLVVLVPVALVAVAAAAPSGGRPLPPLPKRVKIGGGKVGGINAERARHRVRAAFGQPLHFVFGKKRWTVQPSRVGATAAVDQAVRAGLRSKPGRWVPLHIHVNSARLGRYIRQLNGRLSRPAENAQLIGLSNLRPVISSGRPGLEVNTKLTKTRIIAALLPSRRAPIRLAVRHVQPTITPANFGPVLVIQTASHRLSFYEGPTLVNSFTVATGQSAYPTPSGQWTVVDMQRDPWWIPPPNAAWAQGAKPIPPGPGNPLGTRWMGLSAPGVGIHGTPDAASLGYSQSHGCIRMAIPDAEWVFTRVHIGTPVFTVAA